MGYFVRKILKATDIVDEPIKIDECLNSDLLSYLQTKGNTTSVYYCDSLNEVYRCLGSLNITLDKGFEKPGGYFWFECSPTELNSRLNIVNASVQKTLGNTKDSLMNSKHYDICIKTVSQMKFLYDLIFNGEFDFESSPTSTKHIVAEYKKLFDVKCNTISWDLAHKSNIKIIEQN